MKQLKKTSSHGFTLIELMITLVIGAVIAAVAVPAYLKYIQKAKISEGYIMLQKMVHGAYANYNKPLTILIGGEQYYGENRFPLGNMIFNSVGYLQNGTTYRSYAPKPNRNNNEIRIKINNPQCRVQDDVKKICGSIQDENIAMYEAYGINFQVVGGNYKFKPNSYFIPSIRTNNELVTVLQNEGFPAVYTKKNAFNTDIYQVSILSVLADLDGDLDMSIDNDRTCAQNSPRFSLHTPRATYLSRILYIDQNTGELQSSANIIKENVGE